MSKKAKTREAHIILWRPGKYDVRYEVYATREAALEEIQDYSDRCERGTAVLLKGEVIKEEG